jgi:FKBP-type peptidyl-prolyl cis-trans isomerase
LAAQLQEISRNKKLLKNLLVVLLAAFIFVSCSKKTNVVTLKSGLEYSDNKVGSGDTTEIGDLITFHFKGWIVKDKDDYFKDWSNDTTNSKNLIGDSKEGGRGPIKLVLGVDRFIKGINEGIVGMKPGGERTIIIPSDLAYGKQGYGPIPPNSDLKVVVDLIASKKVVQPAMWKVDSTKIKSTKTGLKYVIVDPGSGPKIKAGQMVTVDYNGWLINGKLFDSSFRRDEPFTFVVGKHMVIPGWDEGVQLLKVGSKARLIIPPDLAYGNRNMGVIPPNSTLIFDIQVDSVK